MNGKIPMATLVVVLLCAAPRLTAQEPSTRERELEDLVRQLSDRLMRIEQRLDAREAAEAAAFAPNAVESRVSSLETTMQGLQSSASPDAEKWFSDPKTMRAYWKDGLRLDSNDGSFKLKIGGRIQYDTAFFAENSNLETNIGEDIEDDSEFRRARLYVAGTIHDNIEFKAQYDFADGDADFKDVYMGLLGVPIVGNVRLGHFKEPFSIEELTSSKYITFMERSLANTFAPSRNAGVMFHDRMFDDRMTWAAGFFRETDDFGEGFGGRDYNGTVRLTGLPVYEEEGAKLLHLGVAYTHKNFEGDTVRYRARPEAHLSPRFVDTGAFEADFADVIGVEAAWVNGPFSLQGEYVHNFVESRTMSDPAFWAAAVQVSYFLTGEHRPYKKSSGTFGSVKPKEIVGPDGGWGAWELAARYSHLDLNDAAIDGGRLQDYTFGLNWYLNPNLRITWNYVYAHSDGAGDASVFQWRFQLAF